MDSAPKTTQNDIRQQEKLHALTGRLDNYASLLDNKFRIPGTNIRFGWDALLGLIPGIGDTMTLLFSAVILIEAKRIGAPRALLAKMAANMGIEWLVGMIPVLGDAFDVYWKANIRNMDLLKDHLAAQNPDLILPEAPAPGKGWYWSLILIGGLFLYLVFLSLQQLPI
ncbi:MAG: hypothetical protein AseanaTS_26830 [Candidatus Pelagadaptatus aseana]|uniref:DUF4112 domain-containing protein n=1 Tax=Candidatus Pelagadaptatus aseana TaxID=3120508 RepID=UPI0039B177C9